MTIDEEVLHKVDEHSSAILRFFDIICYPLLFPIGKIMPVEKLPELAFLVIIILYFLTTDYILKVVSVMSVYINLSHMFVGITIMSWGSCAVELINMSLSVKNNQMQMGLTSIISALVLAFLLIIPFAMLFKMMIRSSHELVIL